MGWLKSKCKGFSWQEQCFLSSLMYGGLLHSSCELMAAFHNTYICVICVKIHPEAKRSFSLLRDYTYIQDNNSRVDRNMQCFAFSLVELQKKQTCTSNVKQTIY